MRDAILAAAGSGRLSELRSALEMNEMPPDLAIEGEDPSASKGADPIARLRSASRSFPPPPPAETKQPVGPSPPAAPGAATQSPDAIAGHSAAAATLAGGVADGRDVLDAIARIMARPPALVHAGRDHENAGIYVWPDFAERDLAALTEAERSALAELAGPDAAAAMTAAGRYRGWRIAISADGTWLALSGLAYK